MGHDIFGRVFIGARNKLMSFRWGTKLFQEIEMKILEIVFYFVIVYMGKRCKNCQIHILAILGKLVGFRPIYHMKHYIETPCSD